MKKEKNTDEININTYVLSNGVLFTEAFEKEQTDEEQIALLLTLNEDEIALFWYYKEYPEKYEEDKKKDAEAT